MSTEVNFYSDIKMGSWGFPFHIGCINFSWSIFADDYLFEKPTKYGCEITGKRVWLIENQEKYAIFDLESDKYENTSKAKYFYFPMNLSVGKIECMNLYKNVLEHGKALIIGYTKNIYYSVYQEFKDEKRQHNCIVVKSLKLSSIMFSEKESLT